LRTRLTFSKAIMVSARPVDAWYSTDIHRTGCKN